MSLTEHDLRAIAELTKDILAFELRPIKKRLDGLEAKAAKIDARTERTELKVSLIETEIEILRSDVDDLRAGMEELKEHAEITRASTNTLLAWAEIIDPVTLREVRA